MKTAMSIVIACFVGALAFGQEISKQVISNGGNSTSAGDYQLEQTVGEVVVTTYSQGDVILCQGFQQVDGSTTVSISELDNYSFSYFPNPVINELNIELEQTEPSVNIIVIDQSGKILIQQEVENTKNFKLDLNNFSSGIYFIQIDIQNRKVQFEIVKN